MYYILLIFTNARLDIAPLRQQEHPVKTEKIQPTGSIPGNFPGTQKLAKPSAFTKPAPDDCHSGPS